LAHTLGAEEEPLANQMPIRSQRSWVTMSATRRDSSAP
jgi:hypothetical protein